MVFIPNIWNFYPQNRDFFYRGIGSPDKTSTLVMVREQSWFWDGIFSGSRILNPDFYEFQNDFYGFLTFIPGIWTKSPGFGIFYVRDILGIFYPRDRNFFRGMEYPDKKPPLVMGKFEVYPLWDNRLESWIFYTLMISV